MADAHSGLHIALGVSRRVLLGLWVFGLVVHTGWALTIPEPMDWDPAYYRTVARHIADGDGAVVGALWRLLWIPERLPYPADLHWMPIPSRVLVPGVWLWHAHGDQVTTVAVAALWGPMAALFAAKLGASTRGAVAAGVLGALGLCYARFLSTPDCIAIYGLLGSLAFLEVARGHAGRAGLLGAMAALTRNDGFLLSPCLAVGVRSPPAALAVAIAGPLASLAWHLRNASIAGPAYWAARAATANVLESADLVQLSIGGVAPITFTDRLNFLLTEGFETSLLIWLVALPLPSVALWLRSERWMRAVQAFWLFMPVVSQFMAPGVSSSGSVFRSAAALFPVACGVTAVVGSNLGAWGARTRGYPPWFLPSVLGGGLVVGSFALVLQQTKNPSPLPPEVCRELEQIPAGEPVLSVHPLLLEAHCNRPAVLFVRGMSANQLADLSARFHVRYALVMPEDDGYKPSPRRSDAELLLPGWTALTPRLFAAPPAP